MTEHPTPMGTQETHLKNLIAQQKQIINELNELNTQVAIKKEQGLKIQGIIEYLTQIGVKVEETQEESIPTVTPEVV